MVLKNMSLPRVRNGPIKNGVNVVPLEDLVLDPRRKTVGVISKDPIFRMVALTTLKDVGYAPSDLTLDQVVNPEDDRVKGFYVVDLTQLSDYSGVERAIRAIRHNSPDSELILVGTRTDLKAPKSTRLVKLAELQIVHQSQRPAPPELPVKGDDYEKGEAAFIKATDTEEPVYERKIKEFVNDQIAKYLTAYLSRPNIIKVGGSIFDLIPQNPNVLNLFLDEVARLHQQGYLIILTAGGGLRQDTERTLSIATGAEPDSLSVLERQARHIASILGKDVAVYVAPDEVSDYNFSYASLRRVVPVVSLSGIRGIPQSESDKHTLALAERLALPKVIFAKNTEGVYKWDPNVDYQALVALGESPTQLMLGAENHFYPMISASDVSGGAIDRRSTDGLKDHLIESGALLDLRDKTRSLRAVHVINGTKPELLRQALDGSATTGRIIGSYILKG